MHEQIEYDFYEQELLDWLDDKIFCDNCRQYALNLFDEYCNDHLTPPSEAYDRILSVMIKGICNRNNYEENELALC